ncbi:MAG TPA: hypothetical protein VKA14_07100 [Gammaproteobacteria bacterium]|nr:hypothetical protein [Gammaproteobacteria bacterium]
MEILHLVRSREDLTESIQSILDAEASQHRTRIIYLSDREADPTAFDAELFGAIRDAARVFSW